jgi:hypothetical protein
VLVASFETLRAQDTGIAGLIRVIRTEAGPAVAEYPTSSPLAVIRPFSSMEEAQAFVDERLETYERMWDGCGCRIDYFTR